MSVSPRNRPKVFFATVCALVAAGLSAFAYLKSDSLFFWSWARVHGAFTAEPDPALRTAARDLAEAQNPGKACVEQWLGKDDRYVYLGLGCAVFRLHLGELSVEGDEIFLPTRLRYAGNRLSGIEQPTPGPDFTNGLHRIFPRQVANLWRAQLHYGDYQRRGLARMEERGLMAGH